MPRLPGKTQDIATSSNTSSNSFQVLWYVSQWRRALLAAPWKQMLRQTPPPRARPAKTQTSELTFRTLQKEDLGGPLLLVRAEVPAVVCEIVVHPGDCPTEPPDEHSPGLDLLGRRSIQPLPQAGRLLGDAAQEREALPAVRHRDLGTPALVEHELHSRLLLCKSEQSGPAACTGIFATPGSVLSVPRHNLGYTS